MEEAVRDRFIKILQDQPIDSTGDELIRELAFHQMVERGLEDSKAGRVISNEEMLEQIKSWQK